MTGPWTPEALAAAHPGWEITRAGLKVTARCRRDGKAAAPFPVSPAVMANVLADIRWRAAIAPYSQRRHVSAH